MEFQNSDFFRSFQIIQIRFPMESKNSDHFRSIQINLTKRNLKIQIISDHFRSDSLLFRSDSLSSNKLNSDLPLKTSVTFLLDSLDVASWSNDYHCTPWQPHPNHPNHPSHPSGRIVMRRSFWRATSSRVVSLQRIYVFRWSLLRENAIRGSCRRAIRTWSSACSMCCSARSDARRNPRIQIISDYLDQIPYYSDQISYGIPEFRSIQINSDWFRSFPQNGIQ